MVFKLWAEVLPAAFFNRNICEFREANVFLLLFIPASVKYSEFENFSDNKS